MKEDFLQYLWQHHKFHGFQLQTTQHEPLEIISGGILNFNSGPDFFNGKLRIGHQLWAGTIEIHVKSSNWFLHHHEQDPAYDNVILHVVYEHDIDIYRKDNSIIPTLELKSYIDKALLAKYKTLFSKQHQWINCEQDFGEIPKLVINNWMDRLYFERLESKSNTIEHLLKASQNDWEAILFKLLAKNFGLKVNGEAFLSMANSFKFSVLRKSQDKVLVLEALFFGQSGVLHKTASHAYHAQLKNEYKFLKQKFKLDDLGVLPVQFFRLRPSNFPTLRLSQLASLYHKEPHLFSKIIELNTLSSFYNIFEVAATPFWNTHYTFESPSKPSIKKLTKPFIDLLLINTVLPLKFYHGQYHGKQVDETILDIISKITSEKNAIVDGFKQLQYAPKSALESQALLQLKTEYCDKNKCLNCAVGNSLLNK